MATPTPEIFFVFDAITGAPKAGLVGTLTFSSYKDEAGSDITPPTFTQIAAGIYKFTPSFANPGVHGIVYLINCGAGSNPPYIGRYMRSEDYAADTVPTIGSQVQDVYDSNFGEHSVNTSGPDANKLVVKRPNSSVLVKFDLFDKDNNPAFRNITRKTPE